MVDGAGKTKWLLGTTKSGEGLLELSGDDGKLAARLSNNPTGALLSLLDRTGELALEIGFDSQQVLLVISNHLQPLFQQFRLPILPPRNRESPPQKTDDEKPADGAPDTKTDPSNQPDSPPSDGSAIKP